MVDGGGSGLRGCWGLVRAGVRAGVGGRVGGGVEDRVGVRTRFRGGVRFSARSRQEG